jgi:hypothetical protein
MRAQMKAKLQTDKGDEQVCTKHNKLVYITFHFREMCSIFSGTIFFPGPEKQGRTPTGSPWSSIANNYII